MDKNVNTSPTVWTRPSQVMKLLKQKKRALQSRMTDNTIKVVRINAPQIQDDSANSSQETDKEEEKSQNPFRRDLTKRFKSSSSLSAHDLDASSDNTLFQLLHQPQGTQSSSREALNDSFANFLNRVSGSQLTADSTKKKESTLPLDWSLKSKVRFFSKKALPWSHNLKMLDEASGTTAFARCMDLKSSATSPAISTGANAQLHQTCLVWQHPVLPWTPLFPRTSTEKKKSSVPLDPAIKESLHSAWRESFRSLLQLVRAKQCPYFYLCANKFTCLFRAAGIGGMQDIHVLLSPTTAGFRKLLENDEIAFTLPLQKEAPSTSSSVNTSPADQGYDTQESKDQGSDNEDDGDEEGDDEEALEWLQSMGAGVAEIKKLNSNHNKIKATKVNHIDQKPTSTVLVQNDAEVMALFNFLLNCRSISTTSGHLAGIPPTLLSPVAFHGATLMPLNVVQKTVNLKGEQFFSTEVVGPVLPHTLRELCSQLEPSQGQFSMTCSIVEHSKAFSMLPAPEELLTSAFAQENLRDCGLTLYSLKAFCQFGPTSVLCGVKYENNQYLCQD